VATIDLGATETINAPLSTVWELASDTSRYPEWIGQTLAVTRTDGPARLGSTYDEINKLVGPLRGSSHWTVIEYDPPRRQVHRDASIPFARSFDAVIETSEAGPDRTVFTLGVRGESRLGPIGALVVRLLARPLREANRRNARAFRELVEGETGAGS
jgi:hypothetical protein